MLLTVCLTVGILSVSAQAASQRTKAVKAYKSYLTQISKNRKIDLRGIANNAGNYGFVTSQKGTYFYVSDMNSDKTPELVLKTTVKPYTYVLYTYRSGKIKALAWIRDGSFYRLKGSKKVFVRKFKDKGYDKYEYLILKNGSVKQIAEKRYKAKKWTYYYATGKGWKTYSKSQFNAAMKQYGVSAGTKLRAKENVHKVTQANIKKYCK